MYHNPEGYPDGWFGWDNIAIQNQIFNTVSFLNHGLKILHNIERYIQVTTYITATGIADQKPLTTQISFTVSGITAIADKKLEISILKNDAGGANLYDQVSSAGVVLAGSDQGAFGK